MGTPKFGDPVAFYPSATDTSVFFLGHIAAFEENADGSWRVNYAFNSGAVFPVNAHQYEPRGDQQSSVFVLGADGPIEG